MSQNISYLLDILNKSYIQTSFDLGRKANPINQFGNLQERLLDTYTSQNVQ